MSHRITLVIFLTLLEAILAQVQFRVIRQWKYLNYTWESPTALQSALDNGGYVPENIVSAGLGYYDNWFYITMPRMKNGVPATLGRFTSVSGGRSAPLISPFPSWESNKLHDCNAFQNVQNIEIDTNGKMFIIDGGHTASLTSNPAKNCPPKLVVFDLNSNNTIDSYTFPETVASQNDSFLYDLVVDGDDFVYITDNSKRDPGIIVFSLKNKHSWKIRHEDSMKADTTSSGFKVNDVLIEAKINIAGIALGPKMSKSSSAVSINKDREVFYSPLSSTNLFSISTSVLQNESNSMNGKDLDGSVRDVGLKASQTDGMIMTNHGILYYGLLGDNSVSQWDSSKPFASGQKVIARDMNYIQWTNAFVLDSEGNLTVLSNTLQNFIYGKLDVKKFNFWLLSAKVEGKSYLYEDETYQYSPEDVGLVQNKSTTIKPQTESHLYRVPPKPKPSTEPTPIEEVDNKIEEVKKGGGNRFGLELSVILAACLFLIL